MCNSINALFCCPLAIRQLNKESINQMTNQVFNSEKADYVASPIFLGEEPGLFDSINQRYPDIHALYKRLKSLDWDEHESDFTPCRAEFKTCPKAIRDLMIYTLAWQWEADSVASRTIAPIASCFNPNSIVAAYLGRVGDNENLHALTYSEIVRSSFEDPDTVFKEVLQVKESIGRMQVVNDILTDVYTAAHQYALGQITKQEAFKHLFMLFVALYALERIQFQGSFPVTFAIGESGWFIPIATIVQKICQDEFEIHAQGDRLILIELMKTPEGKKFFQENKELIHSVFKAVIESETKWAHFLFSEGRELPGLTPDLLTIWIHYCAQEPMDFFGFELEWTRITKPPLGFMREYLSISSVQKSPQEENPVAYLAGAAADDVGEEEIDFDL